MEEGLKFRFHFAVYRPSVRNINYPEFSAPMRKFRALFMLCWNTLKIILFKARNKEYAK
ncbi:hypothetical protein J14TS2_07400 [Bacillus sp. J14TS2]|uniref:hypothetical protein n=1 Tax=Bacillus sp. J14TS2 TaxID=2807188 RepID=UPI001B2C2778|nr:hypothetical protein [Bacillus sp. J14TS2]GIN70265.1 hypothetical protein J14TS2_07400 [Bacillus sp. J14TS2]